jgi:glycosyltransferase involved in cell wall biosynthesis
MIEQVIEADKEIKKGNNQKGLQLLEQFIQSTSNQKNYPQTIIQYATSRLEKISTNNKPLQRKAKTSELELLAIQYEDQVINLGTNNNTTTNPVASVIIPHYNSANYLLEAIQSIEAQSYRSIEIIIIDDKSEDREDLSKLISKKKFKTPIKLIALSENKGPSTCRNIGIAISKGRIIIFLDADDYFDEKSIFDRVELLNGWSHISAAFSPMSYVNENRESLENTILKGRQTISWPDFQSNKFPCSALAIKRKYLELDQFKTTLSSGEDYEFFSRLAQRGVVYSECGGIVFYRQHHASLTHKDVLNDVEERRKVSKIVYERELDWSINNGNNKLTQSIQIFETAKRTFPIACILAIKGEKDKAIALSRKIDLDRIFEGRTNEIAGSIRFFITREFIIKKDKIENYLNAEAIEKIAAFLGEVISFKHIRSAQLFLRHLGTARITKNAEDNLLSKYQVKIQKILASDISKINWDSDFYMILMPKESISDESIQDIKSTLKKERHLDGLLLQKIIKTSAGNEYILNSIVSDNADSKDRDKLGSNFMPTPVIDATSLKLITQTIDITDNCQQNIVNILKSASKLRIKFTTGSPNNFVLTN